MQKNDRYYELLRQQAENERRNAAQVKENPLSGFSTSELKAELRRRKKQFIMM